jgi:hypothetical protein
VSLCNGLCINTCMSIETEIAALTAATSDLLAEVNLSKDELDLQISEALGEVTTIGGASLHKTYTQLTAVTGMTAGQSAIVLIDAGTHTDPVVGGTVSNTGIFRYSTSPAGWERIADLISQMAEEQVALASTQADRAEIAAASAEGIVASSLLGFTAAASSVPYGVCARVDSYISTQAPTVTRDTNGKWAHAGTGNTQFSARFKINPSMAAEFTAGRNVRLVIVKESGTFTVNPYVDDTVDITSVVSGTSYTITLDSATYVSKTEFIVRWTASQTSVIVGPHVLYLGQSLLSKNIAAETALKEIWAREIADVAGNQVNGFYLSSTQDLPGDSVGITTLTDNGRCLTVAGNESMTVETTCRGLVKSTSIVTMVYRIENGGIQNEVNVDTLGISSNLTSAANNTTTTRIGGVTMGNLVVIQRNALLTDADSNGTPTVLTMLINNAVNNRVTITDVQQITVRLLGLFVTDNVIQPHKFIAIDEILNQLQHQSNRACIVDNTLVSSDYKQGRFRSVAAALRSPFGHIRLTNGQLINEPSGLSVLRPVRIVSERYSKALIGGWEDKAAASWTNNGNSTYSIVLTHPFRSTIADQVAVERIAVDGATQWFTPATTKAAVAAATAGQFLSFYDTGTKELTINEGMVDAIYRINAGHQRTFFSIRCRSGRTTGEPVVTLENLDIRYSGGNLIEVDGEAVLETRGCRVGRCYTDGIAVMRSGWWRDVGEEPTVSRYTGGNGYSTNTLVNIRPCRMSGNGPQALDNWSNGFEFKGAGESIVEFSGKILTNRSGRRGVYVNAQGSYNIRAVDIGENGTSLINGGGFYCLLTSPNMAIINCELIKADWVRLDSGINATIENVILRAKQGSGNGVGYTYAANGGTAQVQAISYIPDGQLNQDYR